MLKISHFRPNIHEYFISKKVATKFLIKAKIILARVSNLYFKYKENTFVY